MNDVTEVLASNPSAALGSPLAITALILFGLLVVASVVAAAAALFLWIKYMKYNRQPVASGLTALEAARELLDQNQLSDVQVKKAGFLRALVYGNHYNRRRKTVYLRKNIANRNSVTAVGVAVQKVGLVLLDQQGDKQFRVRESLRGLFLFAPVFFIIVLIVGAAIDFAISQTIGQWTTIAAVAGLVYYLAATVYTLFTITTEKKAGKIALQSLEEHQMMTTEEIHAFAGLQQYYMVKY